MKITPVTKEEIPARKYGRNKLIHVLEEFHKMDTEAVKINWRFEGYKSGSSLSTSLMKAARRQGYHIAVMMRGDFIYVAKKDI